MANYEKTAKTGAIGGASALGGSMFLGPTLGPVAGGLAADKLSSGSGNTYTTMGVGIGLFGLFAGGGSGGSRGTM